MTGHPITPRDIERSYQVLELLNVIEHAARNIGVFLNARDAANMGGSIASALEVVKEIAGELHDKLELNVIADEKEGQP